MKIISYNINGIRAVLRKDILSWLEQESADIYCFQEIKANTDQFETQLFDDIGYNNYWFSAQKKGYSGVGIISKIKPNHVEYGCGIEYMDYEGRVIRADFDDFSVISLYVPSGTNIDRLGFKMRFLSDFQNYINELKKDIPNLIICGDYNICHEAIDIHNPIQNAKNSGFLPIEREWISEFIKSGFEDSFRMFDKTAHNYSWWTYRANARANNKGWRIDYNMVSTPLRNNMKSASILSKIVHSDHCPIVVELEF